MMRSIATIGISLKCARDQPDTRALPAPIFGNGRSTRTAFVRTFLSALLILTAAALTGCGIQSFSDARPTLTAEKVQRPRMASTVAAKPKIKRQLRPTFDDGETSQVSPDQISNASAAMLPDKEETTASIAPDGATGRTPTPDPRTVRAMNCRDLMLKQHPTVRFGGNGTATVQREFFDSCMRRAGNAH